MKQTISRDELSALVDAKVKEHGSERAAATALGITQAYVNALRRGIRRGGPKMLAALGYREEVRYRQIAKKPNKPGT